jgi:hypothetical protein
MVSGNPSKRRVTYYHGGMPDLRSGTQIFSKNEAARRGMTGPWTLRPEAQHYSPDRVYFTTDLDLARSFAHALQTPSGRGYLYEVQPIGAVEVDPDYSGFNDVFMAPSARVVRVVQRNLQLTRAQETRPFAMRQYWALDSPYMDGNGYVRPSEQMQKAGWNPALLRLLPQWVPFEDLGEELSHLVLRQTSVVLETSPGIGDVDRARWHKASGLTDAAITALDLARYGSPQALKAAREQLAIAAGTSPFLVVPTTDSRMPWRQRIRNWLAH